MPVKINFMCQHPWTIDYPDAWFKMVLLSVNISKGTDIQIGPISFLQGPS